jgi:hypothetical protein
MKIPEEAALLRIFLGESDLHEITTGDRNGDKMARAPREAAVG